MVDDIVRQVLPEFQNAGRTLLACRCNNSHSGNLSVRRDDRIVITRTGAMLGDLSAGDLLATTPQPTPDERHRASTELPVHLQIYEHTDHLAVAHGHALSAVAAAWLTDELKPIDVEGAYYFGSIPVLEHVPATASPELGQALAAILNEKPIVILRGHGVFAAGDTLERATQRITSVNDSAELFVRATLLRLDTDQLARAAYLDFSK